MRRRLINLCNKYTWLNVNFAIDVIKRFGQFGTVGLSGFFVDLLVYSTLFSLIGVPHNLARIISYWMSASWNWAWNRKFTFDDAPKTRKTIQWAKYMALSLISFVPNVGTYYFITDTIQFFAENTYLAFIAGVTAGVLFNFIGASVYIFRVYGTIGSSEAGSEN